MVSDYSSPTYEAEKCRDLLLVDWDGGCVVDTSSWRIHRAYKAAALLWPELEEKLQTAITAVATATVDRKTSWLTNKMIAIARVLDEDTRYFSATAQHVLAVRLLVEEQELDQGQSPGTGKYGSLYHPRQVEDDSYQSDEQEGMNGSRPLTVGEITLNWCELLLDTLPIKYRVRPSDLESAIAKVTVMGVDYLPVVNTGTMSMLVSMATQQARVGSFSALPVVTVRHDSDIDTVRDILSNHFKNSPTIRIEVVNDLNRLLVAEEWCTIFILHKANTTIRDLMAKSGTNGDRRIGNIHIVESSWAALQGDTSLANHPVLMENGGVGLNLFAWSPTPEMERRAMMCPWSRPCTSIADLEMKLQVQHAGFE